MAATGFQGGIRFTNRYELSIHESVYIPWRVRIDRNGKRAMELVGRLVARRPLVARGMGYLHRLAREGFRHGPRERLTKTW